MTWYYPNEPEMNSLIDLEFVLGQAWEALSKDEFSMAIAMLFGRDDMEEELRDKVKDFARCRYKWINAQVLEHTRGIDSVLSHNYYNEMCDIAEELKSHIEVSQEKNGWILKDGWMLKDE